MFGSDPEEACAFAFGHEQVTLQPGQQKHVEVRVNPTGAPIFASSRLFGFSITARSIESPSVVSTAQAQLEQKPLLTPPTVAFLLAIAILAGFWLYLLPKPPTLALQVDKRRITLGESIQIGWRAQNATNVKIMANSEVVADGTDTGDAATFTPTKAGPYDIEAIASRDGKDGNPQHVMITVAAIAIAPDPQILACKIRPTTLKLGDKFTITYKFNEAVSRAFIDGMQKDLDLQAQSLELVADSVGTKTYTVVAVNKDKKEVRKDLTVVVAQASKASFVYFKEKHVPSIDGFDVTIEWQLSNAERAEISDGVTTNVVDRASGARDFPIAKTTTFTLTAYDANGITVTKSITVEVKPPPPDKTNDGTQPPDTAGTTAGGGTTG